jgi:hypothetical protein
MTTQDQEQFITVRNADDMDPYNFRKHMELRHPDSLGGSPRLYPFPSEYVEECWRTFHDTLHRLELYGKINHDHGE